MKQPTKIFSAFAAGGLIYFIGSLIQPATVATEAIMATKQVGDMTDYLSFQWTQTILMLIKMVVNVTTVSLYGYGIYHWFQFYKERKQKNQTKTEIK